jgi:hypothetical protein
MTVKKNLENQIRGWFPETQNPKITSNNQQIIPLKIISYRMRAAISALSSLSFFAVSVAVGFNLVITNMHYFSDFRVILILVSLLFTLPFGLCVYVTRLSLLGFFAFGFIFLISYLMGISMAYTSLYSILGCLCTALLLTASKVIKQIVSSRIV